MSAAITKTAQYITFKLREEFFALNVAQVREVLEVTQITKLPSAPSFMRGVVNVRGQAVPIVDLRLKFGLSAALDTVHTRIVVIELPLDGGTVVVGGVADSVHEVIELEPGQISPPPRLGMLWRSELVQGIGRHGEEFIIILDINKIFSSAELALVGASGGPELPPGESVPAQ